jgi:nucleotide-binding universal stress UspA family protein
MQSEPETVVGEDLIVEAALFQTGRPMLLIPYIGVPTVKIDRIMIAWDGGSSAARAVGDAMPLLRRAKAVEIVIVTGEERKRDMLPGADLAEHLARHGLNVDVKELVAADDVQPILLSYASDMSADLMVMGGYGHSRLREFILGGVTRDMFESLTIPCLMAH